MKFIQMIDFETERLDEMRELMETFTQQAKAEGRANAPTRRTLLKDRDKPGRYIVVVEFESYEEAMANSNRPETTALSEQMGKLTTGQRTFTNCDVVEQEDL